MLPFAADSFPTTTDELVAAIRRGFENGGVKPRAVVGVGSDFPRVTSLSVDLTGAQLDRNARLSGGPAGAAEKVTVTQFEMLGEPLYFERAALEARIEGKEVQLKLAGSLPDGSLILENAAAGSVQVKMARSAMEALLLSAAKEAAAKQGVDVKSVAVNLQQTGPRSIRFRAEVTAKVFIMSASLALTGNLEIDDEFNARVSSLALDGDAMVTNLAGGFLRPRLEQLEGKSLPLLAFLPGNLNLRNIEVDATDGLQVQAVFGASAGN